MPQPLSKMLQLKTISYGIDACNDRPRHMLEAMRIIAAAAFADHWLGNILVGVSPPGKKVALAKHFNGLEGDAKRASTFEGNAIAFLEPDMHELLHKIVKIYKSAIKARNPFAHHRYGWAAEDEDIIILIDPRHELVERATREALKAEAPGGGSMPQEWWDRLNAAKAELETTIMCYRLAELESIRASIEQATACLTQFWQLTAMNPPPRVRADIFDQLTQTLLAKGM